MKLKPLFGLIATIVPKPDPAFDFDLALAQCRRADTIEIRLDGIYPAPGDFVETLAERLSAILFSGKKVILTLRSKEQGGTAFISADEQWVFWRGLPWALETLIASESSPIYVDWGLDLVAYAQSKMLQVMPFPWTKIGSSWHDFSGTPEDLSARLAALEGSPAQAFLKLVTMAKTAEDVERIKALFAGRMDPRPLTAFCMGPLGEDSRRKCLAWGSAGTYGYPRGFAQAAPGQLSVDELAKDPLIESIQRSMHEG